MNNIISVSQYVPRMRTIRQAAKEANVPEHWLRRAVKEGRVVYVMAGNKALVNLDKLLEYLNTGEAYDG